MGAGRGSANDNNSVRVAVHQSMFLPWVGYWAKAAAVDIMLMWGSPKFVRGDTIHRVKLHGSWCRVAIDKGSGPSIVETRVKNVEHALKRIRNEVLVKRYRYWDRLGPILEVLESVSPGVSLFALNCNLQRTVAEVLGLDTVFMAVTETAPGYNPTERLHRTIVSNVHKDVVYYTGIGAFDYMEWWAFPLPTYIQRMNPYHDYDESIITILAREPDPLTYIKESCSWEPI